MPQRVSSRRPTPPPAHPSLLSLQNTVRGREEYHRPELLLDTQTTNPCFCFRNCGRAARLTRCVLSTLTSYSSASCSGVNASRRAEHHVARVVHHHIQTPVIIDDLLDRGIPLTYPIKHPVRPCAGSALLSAANFAASCTCPLLRPEGVAHALRTQRVPLLASARAASAPKPLEAPVTTITFFIVLLLSSNGFAFCERDLQQKDPDLDHSRHSARSTWPLIQPPIGAGQGKRRPPQCPEVCRGRSSGFIFAIRSMSSCDFPRRKSFRGGRPRRYGRLP